MTQYVIKLRVSVFDSYQKCEKFYVITVKNTLIKTT